MDPEPGDIVQITDGSHPWYPAILVVTTLRPDGRFRACVLIPEGNVPGSKVTQAYKHLVPGQVAVVGRAVFMPGEGEDPPL